MDAQLTVIERNILEKLGQEWELRFDTWNLDCWLVDNVGNRAQRVSLRTFNALRYGHWIVLFGQPDLVQYYYISPAGREAVKA